jgi:magnesium chelatase family protein
VRESLERIHAACSHSGFALPPQHTTINLVPAGTPKHGSALDLPIAVSLLVPYRWSASQTHCA